ncbi:MAG: hypothetical protein IJ757_09540 [Clostridiales bacterium]|nr:hypothetical protein [Clostridiales bacterium]
MALSFLSKSNNLLAWFGFKPDTVCVVDCQISRDLRDHLVSRGVSVVNSAEEGFTYAITRAGASSNIAAEIKNYYGKIDADGAVFVLADNMNDRQLAMLKQSTGLPCHVFIPYPDMTDVSAIFREGFMPSEEALRIMIPTRSASRLRSPRLIVFYKTEPRESVRMVKFNPQRRKAYRVNTFIIDDAVSGRTRVLKMAEDQEAASHVNNIVKNYEALRQAYKSVELAPCQSMGDGIVEMEYIDGVSMLAWINPAKDPINQMKDDLDNVLSWVMDYDNRGGGPVYNLGSDLHNFRVVGDRIICINYEWVTRDPIARGFVKFRALWSFYTDNRSVLSTRISSGAFLKQFGFTGVEILRYRIKEMLLKLKINGV